ncbi:MAG: T9SS type A sorting domain-containing protein [Saprospiraceae bacterium]
MKKLIYTFLILLAFFQISISQNNWLKINMDPEAWINSLASSLNGDFFVCLSEDGRIYKSNIFNDKDEYLEILPELNSTLNINYSIDNQVLIDINDILVPFYNSFAYRKSSSGLYVIDTLKNGILSTGYPEFTIIDDTGIAFEYYISIYKYKEKWNSNTFEAIFTPKDPVTKFFAFTEDNNFSVTSNSNTTEVYKLNTNTKSAKKLITTTYKVRSENSLALRDGTIFLPSDKGLLKYSLLNGKYEVEILLIDTLNNSRPIQAIFSSKDNSTLVAYLSPDFYFSYDTGKSWTKPLLFNKSFPKENLRIIKAEIWDSTHSVMLVQDACAYKFGLQLKRYQSGWKKLIPNRYNRYFTQFFIDSKEIIFGQNLGCNWLTSTDKGVNWNLLSSPSNINLKLSYLYYDESNFFYTYSGSKIFRSTNPRIQWDSIGILPERITDFHIIDINHLIAVTETLDPLNGALKQNLYSSYDQGISWTLIFDQKLNSFFGKFRKDFSNNLFSLYPGAINDSLKISSDNGKSWNVDLRFKDWLVQDLIWSQDSQCYFIAITRKNYNSQRNALYRTKDYITFDTIFKNINTAVFDLKVLNSGEIAILTSNFKDGIGGIYISRNKGSSWDNFTSTLNKSEYFYQYTDFINFYFDRNQQCYFNFRYDGLYKSINRVETKNIIVLKGFTIYPNPTNNQLNIQGDTDIVGQKFKLTDISGKIIINGQIISTFQQVAIDNLRSGIYFLSVGESTQKLIISK